MMNIDDQFRAAVAQDERLMTTMRELVKTGDATSYDDRLEAIFDLQATLGKRMIEERIINMSLDEWVVGLTIAMESEIDEVRREVNWKWWKNPKPIDHDALREEVIDLWHFLVQLSIFVGLTPADVYRIYCDKNAENHARQDGTSKKGGYAVD